MSVEDYSGASELLGPLRPNRGRVEYTPLVQGGERRKIILLMTAFLAMSISFIGLLAWPAHMPNLSNQSVLLNAMSILSVGLILGLPFIQVVGTLSSLHFALRGKLPVPMEPEPNLRIAMLTTIVPSKEPWEQARETMLMFKKQKVEDGTVVDAWVLDEGDDPRIKADCERYGFFHFSRKGIERWNQSSGPFRAKTKHGNHNAWREAHEHGYDIVTQMDPDHKPLESCDFLERISGYFSDPDVAYVVAPQVYGNIEDGIVAKGAAELAYLFHGVIQPGANGLDAPLLIGTNHAFRPAAWQQIGGYQDCIIEDHLTAMQVATEFNPATGNRWKGVYTPDILTAGEGPNTWTDFFSQQKRWAYGVFEIATTKTPKMWNHLTWKQRISFIALQFHYPSVALNWIFGNMVSAMYLLGGTATIQLNVRLWLLYLLATNLMSLLAFFWLRRFNLMQHERTSWGLAGLLLNLITTPIYLAAAVQQLSGRSLTFAVTAKGRLSSGDGFATFRLHLAWVTFAAVAMMVGLLQNHLYPVLYFWMALTLIICLVPVGIWWFGARTGDVHSVANDNMLSVDEGHLRLGGMHWSHHGARVQALSGLTPVSTKSRAVVRHPRVRRPAGGAGGVPKGRIEAAEFRAEMPEP